MRPARAFALALAALALAPAARADEPIEDVLIKGRDAGGFVARAKLEDAPREVTDAASLVEPLPGVHVRRLGADDSFATLSVRGTSSTQVAVFLAGVPLSGGADPTLDLATLPLWPGARARVYRSFAPAALGPGSLGGTLVLDPPSARGTEQTETWAAVGSFGAARLRIGDVRGNDDVRVATGVSASRSDNDFSYLDPLASSANGADVYATRANAGHAAASGLVSVALPVRLRDGAAGALTLTTLAQDRTQRLPGTVTAPTPQQELHATRLVSALELTLPAAGGAVGVRGWGRREGLALRDSAASARTTLGPTSTSDVIVAAGTSLGWKGHPAETSTLEVRVDGSAERFEPGSWASASQPPGAHRASVGAGVDASVGVTRETTLSASVRGDAWNDGGDGSSTFDARPTGHLGAELALGPVVLATHAGLLARPPSFVERYGNRGAFLGDPSLHPESAITADAGGHFARRFGPLRFELELAAFTTWADDLIVFVNQGAYGRAKATNIGKARLLGLETQARVDAWGFDFRVSDTALASANESTCRIVDGGCERPALPGRPAHDVVIDLAYTSGPVRIRYGLDAVTGVHADLVGDVAVPDRVLHSAGVRVAVPGLRADTVGQVTLACDVRNLFDLRVVEYEGALGPVRAPVGDVYEYPLPGRSVMFSARWVAPAAPAP